MNIKQVKGFLELSKTLNFSKTAEKLYMSQPAFSRMIENLEKELGARLIHRDKVHPSLTGAGEAAIPHMEQIIAEYHDMLKDVGQYSKPESLVRVGILEDGLRGNESQILKDFTNDNPEIKIKFIQTSESDAFTSILEQKADCAILIHFPSMYYDKLGGAIIGRCRNCVAMSRLNPLADRSSISVKDLSNEGFIVMDAAQSRFGFNATMGLCLRYGFSPHIAATAPSISMALSEVDMNYGVMILHESMKETAGSDTVFIPLEGEPDIPIWCVYDKNSANPSMRTFLNYIKDKAPQEQLDS